MGVQHSSALHQQLRATTMGQIMLGKHHKESVGSVAELLPTISPGIQERRLDVSPKRSSSSLASSLLVILSIIFAVSALKQICDLREQNLSLMQQLAFERQKDAALKLAVRENVPEDKFMQHVYSPADAGRVEDEGKTWEQKKTKEENMMEQSELSNLLQFDKIEADKDLLGDSVNNKEKSSEEIKENITELSDLLNLIQSRESAENEEES